MLPMYSQRNRVVKVMKGVGCHEHVTKYMNVTAYSESITLLKFKLFPGFQTHKICLCLWVVCKHGFHYTQQVVLVRQIDRVTEWQCASYSCTTRHLVMARHEFQHDTQWIQWWKDLNTSSAASRVGLQPQTEGTEMYTSCLDGIICPDVALRHLRS